MHTLTALYILIPCSWSQQLAYLPELSDFNHNLSVQIQIQSPSRLASLALTAAQAPVPSPEGGRAPHHVFRQHWRHHLISVPPLATSASSLLPLFPCLPFLLLPRRPLSSSPLLPFAPSLLDGHVYALAGTIISRRWVTKKWI